MKVDLSCANAAGIILRSPSGVVYESQTGGTCCHHPSVEGSFVPTPNWAEVLDEAHDDLCWLNASEDLAFAGKVADLINIEFASAAVPFQVDREALTELEEAWIPVVVLPNADYVLLGVAGARGIFVYLNCD